MEVVTLCPEFLGFELEQEWQVCVQKINDSLRFEGIQCSIFGAETRCHGLVLWQVFNEIPILASATGGRDRWLCLSEGGWEGWSWVRIGILTLVFGDEFLLIMGFGETLVVIVVMLSTLTRSIRHFNRKGNDRPKGRKSCKYAAGSVYSINSSIEIQKGKVTLDS